MGFLDFLFNKRERNVVVDTAIADAESNAEQSDAENAQNDCEELIFEIKDIEKYSRNIELMCDDNPKYDMSKKEIINAHMYDEKIFKNLVNVNETLLDYDGDRIKVIMNGVKVGYVPEDYIKEIKDIIENKEVVSLKGKIRGGEYKNIVSYLNDSSKQKFYEEDDEIGFYGKVIIAYR